MANEVEIVVKSRDKTRAGFQSAKREAAGFKTVMAGIKVSADDADAALGRTAATIGKMAAKSAAVALLGSAAAGTVGPLVSMAGAVAAAAGGAAAALPAFAVAGAGAIGTLKLAVSGLGDAMSAVAEGDAEAFTEAVEKLSPAARGVAEEVRGVWPQVERLKRSVQEAVFSRFQGEVSALAGTWLPLLRDRLTGIGAAWGVAFRNAAQAARSQVVVAGVTAALDQTHLALGMVNDAVGPLVAGFGALVGAAAPLIGQAGGGFARLAADFGAFLQQAAASGQLAAFLETMTATLGDLGGIAMQAGGILVAIFQAANASGGGLLNNLRAILTTVNAYLSSAQGQAVLNAIFSTTTSVLATLLPVVGQLAGSFGMLLVALLPMVPPLAQLVAMLAGPLAGAIATVAGWIQRFQGWLVPLAAGILAVVAAVKLWQLAVAAYTAVQTALNVVLAANPIGLVIMAIVALVAIFVVAWKRSETFRNVVKGALGAVAAAGRFLWSALQAAGRGIMSLFGALASFIVSAARRGFLGPIPWIIANWGKVRNFLSNAGATIRNLFNRLAAGVVSAARRGFLGPVAWIISNWDRVTSFFRSLPGRIRSAVSGAGSWLLQAGRNIINGLVNGIRQRVGAVTSAISSVAQKVRNFLPFSPAKEGPLSGSGDPYISGQRIAQNLARGLQAQLGNVAGMAGQLAGATVPAGMGGPGRAGLPAPAPAIGGLAGGVVKVVLELHSGGSREDDLLVEKLRRAVRTRGGNVQLVLGTAR